jgi:protein-disulfide isomerase
MHRTFKYLSVLIVLATLAVGQESGTSHAGARGAGSNLPTEETVNGFLKQTFGYESSITWKVSGIKPSIAEGLTEVDVVFSSPQGKQSSKFYVTADGQHMIAGDLAPFGSHPFEEARKQLAREANGPSHGPADAPVTVVEFSDLQCPHCKDLHPTIEKLMAEDKNVRVIFQSYPLPMHEWAAKAAAYADCVSRSSNPAFWKFIQSIYAAQSDITASNADEKLTGLADSAGVKGSDIAACAAKPDTTTRVEKSIALGKALDVDSTPTLFINGRRVNAVPYEALQKMVEFYGKGSPVASK